ncbi:hypothetical protein CGZ60_09555 [Neisseria animalis]|nr:hypothetical protein CGZ60_09555 [Neisseria animalis]
MRTPARKHTMYYQRTIEQKGLTLAVNVPVVQAVQNAAAAVRNIVINNNRDATQATATYTNIRTETAEAAPA